MRLLLFTGRGGAGTTTVAAATAVHAAACGARTLLSSLDPRSPLEEVLRAEVGDRTVELPGGLLARGTGPRTGLTGPADRARTPSGRIEHVLDDAGLDPVHVADLLGLPGAREILTLLDLPGVLAAAGGSAGTARPGAGDLDLVVLDCPPADRTLQLLSIPETLGSCLEQALPVERRVLRAMSRGRRRHGDGPASDHLAETADLLRAGLSRARDLLTGPGASVRIVLGPRPEAVRRTREARTALCLLGHAVDGLVVNGVPPGGDRRAPGPHADPQELLERVAEEFAPLPVLCSRPAPAEPAGLAALADLGEEVYGPPGPGAVRDLLTGPGVSRFRVERREEEYLVVLPLPHVDRERVRLSRRGDDLVMEVPGQRRVLSLPSALRRCRVTTAALRDGELRVRFRPDPALWPTA